MLWAILLSFWGGFLLGVVFMAILSMARERGTERAQPEVVNDPFAPESPARASIEAMHG